MEMIVIGILSAMLVYQWRVYGKRISQLEAEISRLRADHKKEYEEMMYRFNHAGMIPITASSQGLINLIATALIRCSDRAKEKGQTDIADELMGIVHCEVGLLFRCLDDISKEKRKALEEIEEMKNAQEELV